MPPRFIFRRLAFTGPGKDVRDLAFVDGLNVVWGASNTGKSFTVKAIDFMLGSGSSLPEIDQRKGYDNCWLDLELPTRGRTTLRRSVTGGGFDLYASSFDQVADVDPPERFAAKHNPDTSLSGMLLSELGIVGKRIAKNLNGESDPFTFRHLAAYALTEETPMMSEESPIKIAAQSSDTFDKNVLKFILTGIDDSAVVATKSRDDQKTANSAKIELVDELLASAEEDLRQMFPEDGNIAYPELTAQQERLAETIHGHQSALAERQSTLDQLLRERREVFEARDIQQSRSDEIGMTLQRFALLAEVYDSDVSRLRSLEEGAAALMAGTRRPCPLCGAAPEHQHEIHGLEQVGRSQRAVRVEIDKIQVERSDLTKAQASLGAEQTGLASLVRRSSAVIDDLLHKIDEVKPLEATCRKTYEELDRVRRRLHDGVERAKRIEGMKKRREALAAFKPRTRKRDTISVGIDGSTGHELASIVQSILRAWRFPGDPVVSFDGRTHDILLDGKSRRANGKGVRALMNSAFKIGVLVYCRAENLPHPGIIVLDSPLLTYRDPLTSKHGELTADEEGLKSTGLKEHFYRHVMELSHDAQFIIIENDVPPIDLGPRAAVTTFVGASTLSSRHGFF